MEIIFHLNTIEEAAKKFLQATKGYKVFAFSGDLGAGKTTFISALCKHMGIEETVTSPTYSIIQEYNAPQNIPVYHIDLYRIKSDREAMESGVEDCINSNEICLVEWPEKAPAIFPDNAVFSTFEIISADERKLVVKLPR